MIRKRCSFYTVEISFIKFLFVILLDSYLLIDSDTDRMEYKIIPFKYNGAYSVFSVQLADFVCSGVVEMVCDQCQVLREETDAKDQIIKVSE